jgi:uncharacterized protein YegP (UPF0339 family)
LAVATATKKARTAEQVAGGAVGESESAAVEFLVFEDNGGDYHWAIVAADSESLAQSGSFASYDDAERAARRVYEGAGLARFEAQVAEERQLETA